MNVIKSGAFIQDRSNVEHQYTIFKDNDRYYSVSDYPNDLDEELEIITFDPKKDNELREKVEKYREEIINNDDPLINNYSVKNFNLYNQVCVTAVLKRGEVKGFSSAWNRDCYGKNSVRILNRFWMDKEVRFHSTMVTLRLSTFLSIVQQVEFLKEYGYKWAFISRDYKSKLWSKKMERLLNLYSKGLEWENPESAVLVCPDKVSRNCWQNVIWTSLNELERDEFPLLKRQISEESWKILKG